MGGGERERERETDLRMCACLPGVCVCVFRVCACRQMCLVPALSLAFGFECAADYY